MGRHHSKVQRTFEHAKILENWGHPRSRMTKVQRCSGRKNAETAVSVTCQTGAREVPGTCLAPPWHSPGTSLYCCDVTGRGGPLVPLMNFATSCFSARCADGRM